MIREVIDIKLIKDLIACDLYDADLKLIKINGLCNTYSFKIDDKFVLNDSSEECNMIERKRDMNLQEIKQEIQKNHIKMIKKEMIAFYRRLIH